MFIKILTYCPSQGFAIVTLENNFHIRHSISMKKSMEIKETFKLTKPTATINDLQTEYDTTTESLWIWVIDQEAKNLIL